MGQTSITAAALVVAFVIFITVRGELPYYFGALGLGSNPEQGPAAAGTNPTQAMFPITGGRPGVLVGPGGINISYPNGLPIS